MRVMAKLDLSLEDHICMCENAHSAIDTFNQVRITMMGDSAGQAFWKNATPDVRKVPQWGQEALCPS
jgi:hypothetical protein